MFPRLGGKRCAFGCTAPTFVDVQAKVRIASKNVKDPGIARRGEATSGVASARVNDRVRRRFSRSIERIHYVALIVGKKRREQKK